MPMLNFSGGAPGALPTMPGSIPGAGSPPPDPGSLGGVGMPGPGGPMMGPPPGGPMPPDGGGGFPPVGMTDPSNVQYVAKTQSDGTVLLHVQNPDGSLGPAVKIVPAIKPKGGMSPASAPR